MKHLFSKRNIVLVKELVRTDFKLRYQNSVLGYAWSLLRPLLLFAILYIVFVKFLKLGAGIEHYPIYLLLGIVIWTFFIEMTTQSLGAIVGRGDLIRKIKIPRWIIIIATSISALINFSINLVVVVIFMLFNHVSLSLTILWLPLIFVEIYLLALGVSLFLSALYVKYRDVVYIWEVLLQALFYFTPILYPVSLLPYLWLQKIVFINPLAQAIQDARYSVVTHQTVTAYQIYARSWLTLIPFAMVLITLTIGIIYFRRESKYFAENV